MLVLALLGYQIKPFRMSIPALGCCEFLKIIESLLDGWMAIYTTSALSPCPEPAKISIESEVVRVNWSRVDLNECVVTNIPAMKFSMFQFATLIVALSYDLRNLTSS